MDKLKPLIEAYNMWARIKEEYKDGIKLCDKKWTNLKKR